MKVKELYLRHCHHFTELQLKLNPAKQPVTIILGAQASGKTAVLKNIYHALSWFSARYKDLRTAGIVMLDSEIKQSFTQSKIRIAVQYPPDLGILDQNHPPVEGEEALCRWKLLKTMTNKGVGYSTAETGDLEHLVGLYQKAIQTDPTQGLPMIAYYPSDRFINEINLLSKNNPAVLQTQAAYEFAPLPYTTFARFFEWFREISDIENARFSQMYQKLASTHKPLSDVSSKSPDLHDSLTLRLLNLETEMQLPSLKALKTALKTVFPQLTDIYIEYSPKLQLMLRYQDQDIPFTQLSNSLRQWVCLVGDVVRRLCILNPHSISPCSEGEGILLIDNIDAQIDIDFQQTILDRLHRAFPQVQIIVSACSKDLLENEVDYQYFHLIQQRIFEIDMASAQAEFEEAYHHILADTDTLATEPDIAQAEPLSNSQRLFQQFKDLSEAEQQQFIQFIQDDDFKSPSPI